jgi:hypothetical protein
MMCHDNASTMGNRDLVRAASAVPAAEQRVEGAS